MVHEYAVDPELVATWIDRKAGRYFIDKFGIGTPRIISQYPRRWKKRVWNAWLQGPESREGNPIVRQRMVELIENLSSAMTRRADADWDQGLAWLENARREHLRTPFHAILTRQNTGGHRSILVADDMDEKVPLWNHPRSVRPSRTPAGIAHAVGGVLRIATDIVFVDPYFSPHRPRFFNVISECFRMCFENRAVANPRIRILSSDRDTNGTFEFFERECLERLPHVLPAGQDLTVRRLHERLYGERLHNRYILTDLGGVSLGTGLDEDEDAEGATDDLSLLDRQVYRDRWQQYASVMPAFDCREGAITVTGMA